MTDEHCDNIVTVECQLQRHQQRRRRQGTPTVSVLSGPVGLGVRHWNQWCDRQQRRTVTVGRPELAEAVGLWDCALGKERDLVEDAFRFLADRLGQTAEVVRGRAAAKTPYEVRLFLDEVLPVNPRNGPETVCRWLVEKRIQDAVPPLEALAFQIDALLQSLEGPWLRVVSALGTLLPAEQLPGILFAPQEHLSDALGWLDAAARWAAALATRMPALPTGIAALPEYLAAYQHKAPESHARALLRETVIAIPHLEAAEVRAQVKDILPAAEAKSSIRRLAADGASADLVELFTQAARCAGKRETLTLEEAEQARSAAERFLFDRLESLSRTAGKFALNAGAGFPFGQREAEIDLLSQELKLAIEIDGYYHFKNSDSYRRDRRKDFELQKRGYLVIRFLADDVVARLEEILDTILAAVALRSSSSLPGERERNSCPSS